MRMTLEERRKRSDDRKAGKPVGPLPPQGPKKKDYSAPKPWETIDDKVHVPRIMDPDPNIFPPKLRLALQHYLDFDPRDPSKAAKAAKMDVEEFRKHLHSPGVRTWLKNQEDAIDEKMAELRAKARMLTHDHLDAAVVDLLQSPSTPAAVKATVVTTGYRRFGMLKDRSEVTGAGGAALAFELVRIGSRKKESDVPSNDTSSL